MSVFEAYILRRRKLGKGSTNGITQASTKGIKVFRNDQNPPKDPNLLCIRWGCTSSVEQKNVLNTAKGIHEVSDKKGFRSTLGDLAPRTWSSYTEWSNEYIKTKNKTSYFPVVVRPAVHAQGKHCYRCNNIAELGNATTKCGNNYYISKFIDKVAEYRVFVCQGRAVWVANKIPGNPQDTAWNVAQGGKFENVKWSEWNLNVVQHAIDAMALCDLDFGGVDIMVDKDGNCYCLEINSAPSQTSPYRQQCVAKVFDYICEHGKEKIPLGSKGKYLRYIHPALDDKAIIN